MMVVNIGEDEANMLSSAEDATTACSVLVRSASGTSSFTSISPFEIMELTLECAMAEVPIIQNANKSRAYAKCLVFSGSIG
jgi:hypothetical protein